MKKIKVRGVENQATAWGIMLKLVHPSDTKKAIGKALENKLRRGLLKIIRSIVEAAIPIIVAVEAYRSGFSEDSLPVGLENYSIVFMFILGFASILAGILKVQEKKASLYRFTDRGCTNSYFDKQNTLFRAYKTREFVQILRYALIYCAGSAGLFLSSIGKNEGNYRAISLALAIADTLFVLLVLPYFEQDLRATELNNYLDYKEKVEAALSVNQSRIGNAQNIVDPREGPLKNYLNYYEIT